MLERDLKSCSCPKIVPVNRSNKAWSSLKEPKAVKDSESNGYEGGAARVDDMLIRGILHGDASRKNVVEKNV
jgi:hypothetical protein